MLLVIEGWPRQETVWAAHANCMPVLLFHGDGEECFLPAQIRRAELRMPVAVVNPVGPVRRWARLPLSQVILTTEEAVSGAHAHVTGIHYIFGRLPGHARGIPYPSPKFPKFVVVEETIGRSQLRGIRVTGRDGLTINGAFHGPWELFADIPDRNLALSVSTNVSRSAVRYIGLALREQAHGK